MIGTAIAQFTVNAFLPNFLDRRLSPAVPFAIDPGLQRILIINAAMTLTLIVLGYIFFISFASGEGKRVYGALTELRLANEIHRSLVPPISRKLSQFEIAAVSVPSGEMGGDLVDVVENHAGWIAYMADVSGHGVSAGVIMSMVKSAVRMGAQKDGPGDLSELLGSVNSVLTPLSSSSTFVTLACVAANGGAEVRYTLAGHLPLLHYRRSSGTVEEVSIINFPLGMFGDACFTSGQLQCDAGDVLALLTDGLTEITDRNGDELGLGPLKEVLARDAERPLDAILRSMRERALAFGKQTDDQSILLVRRTN
jgi:sigma-B regulation protein RsbU (phosphoserine phosphatase)